MTRAIECSMGVSVVKGEGRVGGPARPEPLANIELFSYIIGAMTIVKEF